MKGAPLSVILYELSPHPPSVCFPVCLPTYLAACQQGGCLSAVLAQLQSLTPTPYHSPQSDQNVEKVRTRDVLSVWPRGHTQVTKRSTHARPGMRMQQRSAMFGSSTTCGQGH